MEKMSIWKLVAASLILISTIGSLWLDWMKFVPSLLGILVIIPSKTYEKALSPLLLWLYKRKPRVDMICIQCYDNLRMILGFASQSCLKKQSYYYPPTSFKIQNFTYKHKPWESGIDDASLLSYRWIYSVDNISKCWSLYMDPDRQGAKDCTQKEAEACLLFDENTRKPAYLLPAVKSLGFLDFVGGNDNL